MEGDILFFTGFSTCDCIVALKFEKVGWTGGGRLFVVRVYRYCSLHAYSATNCPARISGVSGNMESYFKSPQRAHSISVGPPKVARESNSPSLSRLKKKKKKKRADGRPWDTCHFSKTGPFEPFASLPPLQDAAHGFARSALIKRKLHALCRLFDFSPVETADPAVLLERDAKRRALMEVLEYACEDPQFVHGPNTAALVRMVAANMLRVDNTVYIDQPCIRRARKTVPDLNDGAGLVRGGGLWKDIMSSTGGDDAVSAVALCAWWPHQQIIYEILLRFVVSPHVDAKALKRYVPRRFIRELVGLTRTSDPRERTYVKTVIHRLYEKATSLRTFIRRCMEYQFFNFMMDDGEAHAKFCCVGHEKVDEGPHHSGLNDLLKVYGTIVDGYRVPLRPENLVFFEKILLPLHKVQLYSKVASNTSACLKSYLEKDASLAVSWVRALTSWWPWREYAKMPFFFNELTTVLELMPPGQFEIVAPDVFRILRGCILDPHFQVAEQALLCWRSEYFVSLMAQNRQMVVPLVYPALYQNSKTHWHPLVKSLSANVLKLFLEIDPYLVQQTAAEYKQFRKVEKERSARRREAWEGFRG